MPKLKPILSKGVTFLQEDDPELTFTPVDGDSWIHHEEEDGTNWWRCKIYWNGSWRKAAEGPILTPTEDPSTEYVIYQDLLATVVFEEYNGVGYFEGFE